MDENFTMSEIEWVGFDLDDTLHYFRDASSFAMGEVYTYLEDNFGCSPSALKEQYANILKAAQDKNFTENKPSWDYRRDRFTKLLEGCSILPHIHLEEMLHTYENALEQATTPRPFALETLQRCKTLGLNIMIITESPFDAQQRALDRLGMSLFVDLLVTSSQEGISKTDGLISRALEKAQCLPEHTVYLGDNLERDILPALEIGVPAILVSETKPDMHSISCVQTLEPIARILEKAHKGQFPVPSYLSLHK